MTLLESFEQVETVYFQRIVQKLKIGQRGGMKINTELEVESIRKMATVYIVSHGYETPPCIRKVISSSKINSCL